MLVPTSVEATIKLPAARSLRRSGLSFPNHWAFKRLLAAKIITITLNSEDEQLFRERLDSDLFETPEEVIHHALLAYQPPNGGRINSKKIGSYSLTDMAACSMARA